MGVWGLGGSRFRVTGLEAIGVLIVTIGFFVFLGGGGGGDLIASPYKDYSFLLVDVTVWPGFKAYRVGASGCRFGDLVCR